MLDILLKIRENTLENVHENTVYCCSNCSKSFTSNIKMKNHYGRCKGKSELQENKNEMNNVVNEFEASTENIVPTESIFSDKFNDFIKIQKLTYSCIECKQVFSKKNTLKMHMYRSHVEKARLKCTFCKQRYQCRKH